MVFLGAIPAIHCNLLYFSPLRSQNIKGFPLLSGLVVFQTTVNAIIKLAEDINFS